MVILDRMLKIDSAGHQAEAPVKLYLPVNLGDHWQCEYEIGWPDNARRSKACCIDSVQCLLLALNKVAAEIYTSEAHKSGKLIWEKRGDGYGFPLPAGIRDFYEGSDRFL